MLPLLLAACRLALAGGFTDREITYQVLNAAADLPGLST